MKPGGISDCEPRGRGASMRLAMLIRDSLDSTEIGDGGFVRWRLGAALRDVR